MMRTFGRPGKLDRVSGRDHIEWKEDSVSAKCTHVKDHVKKVKPHTRGCEECLKIGDSWVHLRMCLECGKVGCCDSSKNRHATAHFHEVEHPIVRSIEPGEDWRWCYIDRMGRFVD